MVQNILSGIVPASTTPTFTFTKPLSLGMHNSDVTQLQRLLVSLGLLPADSVTGYFGSLTKAAVGAFQIAHHLVTSKTDRVWGYVGPKTRTVLNTLSAGA